VPRVVPSQVVAVIDRVFDWAQNQAEGDQSFLSSGNSVEISAVLDLVERIPDELFILDNDDFATLRLCVAGLREQVERWHAHGDHIFRRISGLPHLSPITLVRRCLVKCPDEAPAPGTTELAFITDQALRDSIRLDISAANQDLAQGEWKGATVLAGSAVEALLLWALQEHERKNAAAIRRAVTALMANQKLSRDPGGDLEGPCWHLHEYVEVAAHLGIIKPDTASQVRLAKDARNLVHPGRAARLGQKCDRATALTALAAVEAVARDLTP
jgi:hypothetical protein